MLGVSIVLLAVFGLLCALVIHDCNRTVERERYREWNHVLLRLWIPEQVQRRYWHCRYPSGHPVFDVPPWEKHDCD